MQSLFGFFKIFDSLSRITCPLPFILALISLEVLSLAMSLLYQLLQI